MRTATALLSLSLLFTGPAVALAETAEALARSIAERSDRAVLEVPESPCEAPGQWCALKVSPGAIGESDESWIGLSFALPDFSDSAFVMPTADVRTQPPERVGPSRSSRLAWVPHYRC